MAIRSIKECKDLEGKKVLLRVDFNVPIEKKRVLDDSRLEASLPTIQYLIEKGAKTVVMTHVGRPDGKRVAELKTDVIAERLSQLLEKKVRKVDEVVGKKVQQAIDGMKNADVLMLENIRFSSDENKNTGTLAADLASYADMFVLDGFAVAHRASASVVGLAQHLPSYAGLLLAKEIEGLTKVTHNPKKPFVAIIGGAKIETKIPVLNQFIEKADHILVGGGLVNTLLKARGFEVCNSLVDMDFAKEAELYCSHKKIVCPVDLVVGSFDGKRYRVVEIGKEPHTICEKGEAIYDIGPASIQLFSTYIKKAKTIVWNGALGYFEQKPYDTATLSIARLVASTSKGPAFGVIGGGETLQAMDLVGMKEHVDLVSTGGGAMLEFLGGEDLPGIVALGG